jgi:putative nucleotidyltransferase with HDIG domain
VTARAFAPLHSAAPAPSPASLLEEGCEHERRGRVAEAQRAFELAIDASDETADARVLAEALRRLANVYRRRHELDEALKLCRRSHRIAVRSGDAVLAAEALNGAALVYFARGDWDDARRELARALAVGAESETLRARVEQNLGIMSNAEGDLEGALRHYERSLASFRAAGDARGCAIALHNIGMNNADRSLWHKADDSFRASLEIANSIGDVAMRGQVLLNRTEVLVARQDYEAARQSAEEALRIFDTLEAREPKANAYKWLGVLYRETGRPLLAEARLKTAFDLSSEIGATLAQAETSRELGLLYGQLGRNQDTLRFLSSSHRLFGRLNARRDLVDVAGKIQHLEGIYLEIVRQWGASIESSDSYTFGHSERVAEYSVAVAKAYGVSEAELTAIRIGAHLHDLGKIRVPHEILNKPGKLSDDEFDTMKMHPVFGIELLAAVEFPWDVKPIIRSHHEKQDGSGYPDRLRGDEIALSAQLVCVVDVYDALTTTRSYRPAMTHARALEVMNESLRWWKPEVFDAFMASVGTTNAE